MDGFFKLRADKQQHIIDAALVVFSRNGYKKASISDIADKAGIAKGMVNYYFGSKKNLYLYLMDMCGRTILEEIDRRLDKTITDYFEKVKTATEIKIASMKKHFAIIPFMSSLYYEQDREVREEIKAFVDTGMAYRENMLYEGIDLSRFKEDVDPMLLDRFFVWAAEGITKEMQAEGNVDKLDAFILDFYRCLDLMKKYFYR